MLNRYKILVLVLLIFILMGAVSASENVTGTSTNNDAVTGDVLASPDNGQVSSVANSNNNVGNVTNVTKNNNINLLTSSNNNDLLTASDVIYVNGSYTGGDSDGSQEKPYTNMNDAFDNVNASGSIYVAPGTYTGTANTAFTVSKNVSLYRWDNGVSGDVIFDGENTRRSGWSINATTFNINGGFVFRNGKVTSTNYGGAIYFNSSLNDSVINATFTSNTAEIMGGAIYIYDAVSNVVFDGNFTSNKMTATGTNYGGGAIYFANTVTDSKFLADFTGNTATYYGGAIYIASTATSNVFRGAYNSNKQTSSGYYGGAIYIKGASSGNNFTADFISNAASGYGGAIYMSSTSTNDLFRGNFSGNTAPRMGGAVYIGGAVKNGVFDGNFTSNSITTTGTNYGGGALRLGTVTDSKFLADFTSNTATYCGGAIYITGNTNNNIFGGVYTGNKQTTSGSSYGGGAIYMTGYTNGNNFTADFISNTAAGAGGAISMASTSTNNLFRDNFTGNKADYYGSAVYIAGAVSGTVIINSTFLKNQARCISLTVTQLNNNNSAIIFTGYNNWINAIYTSNNAAVLSFNNVTYYNGNIVNSDDVNPKKSTNEVGINVKYNVCFYYSDGSIEWFNSTGITNDDGQILINTKPLDYTAIGNMYLTNTDYYVNISTNVHNNYLNNTYVDGLNGKDNNPGTMYLPYKTMNDAFSHVSGNSIYIAPGTYSGTSNTAFDVSKIVSLYRWDNGVSGDVIFDGENTRRSGWNIKVTSFNIYGGFVFRNGKVTSNYGGAIYFTYGLKNSVINATFISNTAQRGGAIYFSSTVTGSKFLANFTSNSATYYGGAIYFSSTATNNVFCGVYSNNKQTTPSKFYSYGGGAIYMNGAATGNNFTCNFTNNGALCIGSVIYANGAFTNNIVNNSIFLNNKESGYISTSSVSFDAVNNLIIIRASFKQSYIHAIYLSNVDDISSITLSNVLYWNGSDIVNSDVVYPTTLPHESLNLKVKNGTSYPYDISNFTDDNGNILFIIPYNLLDIWDFKSCTYTLENEEDDYYYSYVSPNYDFNSIIFYFVDGTAGSDSNDGSARAPFKTMSKAFTTVSDGSGIFVAPGTYKGTSNTDFSVTKSLSLYRWNNGKDGDVIFDGQSTRRSGWTISATTFNINGGFVFTNGKVSSSNSGGGALYFTSTLSNSVINANFIRNTIPVYASYGGAIFINGTVNNVIFIGNFTNNDASYYYYGRGGAIYFADAVMNSKFLANFTGNKAYVGGGAICFMSTVSNNVFIGVYYNNGLPGSELYSSTCGGAAIYIKGASSGNNFIADFIDNYARMNRGGALYIVSNCNNDLFKGNYANNYAGDQGGAISIDGTVNNVIFIGNFTNNKVTNTNEGMGHGGAIYFADAVMNSKFLAIVFYENNITYNLQILLS